ncbi:MAG: alcohol dehydrogenase family protein [candidate division KSB1 bacterium]|nr:alcohol dehydrogenase family protein [candidate division KSB1 bacterium]
MNGLVFRGIRDIRYEPVPDPRIEAPDDALVRVRLAGICGSDMHVYHGREQGLDVGTVMGHEMVGDIVAVGSAIQRFRPGQRVGSPFTTNCGGCFYCRTGLTARCECGQLFGWRQNGKGLHGMQAEFVRVPKADSTLFAIPEDVDDREALLLGDVLPTGYYCAARADIDSQSVCVVLGCGPVGLMAVAAARYLGCQTIFAVDSVPDRLSMAAQFGALPLDLHKDEVAASIMRHTDGRGADAVLEAVGSPQAMRLAYELVRPGGVISTVGVHTESGFAFSPAEAYDKNLTFRIGRCPARALLAEAMQILRAFREPIRANFTHELSLSQGAEGVPAVR